MQEKDWYKIQLLCWYNLWWRKKILSKIHDKDVKIEEIKEIEG